MTIVTPLHHHYSSIRLADVLEKMRHLGAPRIHACHDPESGFWFALEGTHRLRAALALDLAPVLVQVRWPRSRAAMERARFAALERGHVFARVVVA